MVRELSRAHQIRGKKQGVVASLEVFVIAPAVSMSPLNRDERRWTGECMKEPLLEDSASLSMC
jgi:hypothetical protein